ncbi:hypothetical protein J2X31_001073 [Flavobacterium arsenatis]|uniref:Peptidase C14 caspase domain-containing protein n=1 Tax=Flavobacterium arsenatis TaxID=1484332 RepID=A0ABU1TNR0_9FLAO|nr:caspase family protein [Flavobacterium arsenatis]MDR6967073.1 hypothetical protein [Flavobacterium arsenatis]
MPKNLNDYAVVVGVSHYSGLATLKGPEGDAYDFRKWLLEDDGGSILQKNCHLILSTEDLQSPIQHTIDLKFAAILKELDGKENPGRRLYFYFSGHGLGVEWNDTALVLPPWSETFRNYALSSSRYLKTLIESGYFEEVLVFLDCCRNRMVGVTGASPYFGNVRPEPGQCGCYGFSATEFDNKAFEALIQPGNGNQLDNSRTRGLFTTALLNGLKGGAEQNGEITTVTLADYLKRELPELAKKKQKMQIPTFYVESHLPELTIIAAHPPKEIVLLINFITHGEYIYLEDSNLEVLKEGDFTTGPWSVPVQKGLYAIRFRNHAKDIMNVRIDGTLTEISYDI